MYLKLTAAQKSDVGKQREQNEDTAYIRSEAFGEGDSGLFIVADGMGGYQAGEVASQLAIETMSNALASLFMPISERPTSKLSPVPSAEAAPTVTADAAAGAQSMHQTRKLPEMMVGKTIEEQFIAAVQQANKAIIRYGEQKTSARGLGCTVTAAFVQNEQAYIANVGDSRTYLLRDGVLKPLTKDHSLVAKLVEAKQIEPDEVYSHPQRNLIYRSLGAGHRTVDVDVFHESLQPGDVLLLCSDGLWEMVRSRDLLKELSAKSGPQQVCDTLIDLANANGGEDNITAIVVQITAA